MITNIQSTIKNFTISMPQRFLSSLTDTQIKVAAVAAAIIAIIAIYFIFPSKNKIIAQRDDNTDRLPSRNREDILDEQNLEEQHGDDKHRDFVPLSESPKITHPSKEEKQQPKIAFNIIGGGFFKDDIEDLLNAFFDKKNIKGNYDRLEEVIDEFISGHYESKIGFVFNPTLEDCSKEDQSEFKRTGCIAYQEKDKATGLIKTNIALATKCTTNFTKVKDSTILLRNHLIFIGRELKRAIAFEKGLEKPEKIVGNVVKTPPTEKESVPSTSPKQQISDLGNLKTIQIEEKTAQQKEEDAKLPEIYSRFSFKVEEKDKDNAAKLKCKQLLQLIYDEKFIESLGLDKSMKSRQVTIIQAFIKHNQDAKNSSDVKNITLNFDPNMFWVDSGVKKMFEENNGCAFNDKTAMRIDELLLSEAFVDKFMELNKKDDKTELKRRFLIVVEQIKLAVEKAQGSKIPESNLEDQKPSSGGTKPAEKPLWSVLPQIDDYEFDDEKQNATTENKPNVFQLDPKSNEKPFFSFTDERDTTPPSDLGSFALGQVAADKKLKREEAAKLPFIYTKFGTDENAKHEAAKLKCQELFLLIYDEKFVESLGLEYYEKANRWAIIEGFIKQNEDHAKDNAACKGITVFYDPDDSYKKYLNQQEFSKNEKCLFNSKSKDLIISDSFVGKFMDYRKTDNKVELKKLFLILVEQMRKAVGTAKGFNMTY